MSNHIKEKSLTWIEFKNLIGSKNVVVEWVRTSLGYVIRVNFDTILYSTFIFTNLTGLLPADAAIQQANRVEFENNFKFDSGGNISNLDVSQNSKKLRHDQIIKNQVISTSSYTTIYSYSGSGLFYGFFLNMKEDNNLLKVIVDSTETVFDGFDLSDLEDDKEGGGGGTFIWSLKDNKKIIVEFPRQINFESQIEVQLQGIKTGKTLRSGYVVLTKET